MPGKFSGKSICKLYTFKKSYYVTIISDDGISVTLFQSSMIYKGSRYVIKILVTTKYDMVNYCFKRPYIALLTITNLVAP